MSVRVPQRGPNVGTSWWDGGKIAGHLNAQRDHLARTSAVWDFERKRHERTTDLHVEPQVPKLTSKFFDGRHHEVGVGPIDNVMKTMRLTMRIRSSPLSLKLVFSGETSSRYLRAGLSLQWRESRWEFARGRASHTVPHRP